MANPGRRLLFCSAFCAALLAGPGTAVAWSWPWESAAADTVSVARLPPQGRETYRLIHAGGPFPYDKDGMVFGNRERLLPVMKRGYYREYTVATPGASNRGARRIVCGGENQTRPAACYYTGNHYSDFKRIIDP